MIACHIMSATFMNPSNHNTLYHFRLLHGGAAAVVVGMMVGRHVAPASIGSTAEQRDLLLYSPNAKGVVAVAVVAVHHASCWCDPEVDDIDDIILQIDIAVVVDAETVVASTVAASIVVDDAYPDERKDVVVHGQRRSTEMNWNPSW